MRLLLSIAAALLAATANAQQTFEYWSNADYDPSIPTVESVVGHAPGERITWHADALRYFRALESSQPDRVSVHRYASSWEGRELVTVVVCVGAILEIPKVNNRRTTIGCQVTTSRSATLCLYQGIERTDNYLTFRDFSNLSHSGSKPRLHPAERRAHCLVLLSTSYR